MHEFSQYTRLNEDNTTTDGFMCVDCKKFFMVKRAAQMHKNMMKRWHKEVTQ